ncbi:MAG: hypothetical protein VKJ27_02020 [Synechocystis sp.]|nr:hypothetical protein [Synechocystis sp.]
MSLPSLNAGLLPTQMMILAPQGAEYQAIAKGLGGSQRRDKARFCLQSIPAGHDALLRCLDNLGKTWTETTQPQALLVMGVTGSLNPDLGIGQPVMVTTCGEWRSGNAPAPRQSDRDLSQTITTYISRNFDASIPLVKGITVTQVISQASAKQTLAQQSGADVVDMENVAILQFAQQRQIPIAILRVVSDSVDHDLPNLDNIYDLHGNLKPWTLATRFLRRPVAALRLIQGSLMACQRLTQLATILGKIP